MMAEYLETFPGDDRITLRDGEILGNHFLDQLRETDAWLPAKF